MQIRITTVTLIDCTTGAVQAKSTWKVEGEDQGLGPALAQAHASLGRTQARASEGDVVTTALEQLPPSDYAADRDERPHPDAHESRIIAGLLEIRQDVEQALTRRPPGRVLEVLKWIRARRSTTNIRSVPALFWSLVSKD